MLRALQIENFGLIERADVDFADGATIFTGETGSGKTMLLGALDFVLGARAGADVVRRGAPKAFVMLEFEPDEALRLRLAGDGFETDPGEAAAISREMTESGRSALRINGRAATAAYVREMRAELAELVGQHEAQRLLSPAYHLELLDRFAGDAALERRASVAAAYARAEAATKALASLTQDEGRARERYDEARYTAREIDDARLVAGEPEQLNERRTYLENIERIATALHAAHEALSGEERGATGALGNASAALSGIGKYESGLGELAERASALQSEAVDLAAELSRALEAAEYDPGELEAINARLSYIERLQRKYGATFEEILTAAKRAKAVADEYENRDRHVAGLEAECGAAQSELQHAATALSALRRRAATALSKRIGAEFAEIALASGRFDVAIDPLERIGVHGAERVEFLFAANAGEPARALARVASGGELSRVLLALVVVLAGARELSATLVFDEIDAGIGGGTATAVGARIGELARRGQVVCVTHLAQLATWADRHYVLEKVELKAPSTKLGTNQTTISVRPIANAKEREAEIARMLSGEPHDAALRHARALLARNA